MRPCSESITIFRRLQKSNEFIAKLMRSELSNEWLQTLEENLKLLEEEKKTKLKGIILNMREELRNIWDKLYYGQVNTDKHKSSRNMQRPGLPF